MNLSINAAYNLVGYIKRCDMLNSKFLILVFSLLMISCHSDEPDSFWWDAASAKIIERDLGNLHPKKVHSELLFGHVEECDFNVVVDYPAECKERFVAAYFSHVTATTSILHLIVSPNNSVVKREAEVIVTINKQTKRLKVVQRGEVGILVTQSVADLYEKRGGIVPSDFSGILTVKCQSDVELSASLVSEDETPWCEMESFSKLDDGISYEIKLRVAKNVGLGRIAGLRLEAISEEVKKLPIQQDPAPFDDEVVVKTTRMGQLWGMLGFDRENFGRISTLKIEGILNMLDMAMLAWCVNEENVADGKVKLDLGAAHLAIKYVDNYYAKFGASSGVLEKVRPQGWQDERIAPRLFYGSTALGEIILPGNTECVGLSAFEECRCLSRVQVPNALSVIEGRAFSGCNRLKTVAIGKNSCLNEISDGAFLWTNIDNMYLPETCSLESGSLGIVQNLYVCWDEPPVTGLNKVRTLYVPYGCKERYQKCYPSKNIVEWNPDTYEM